VVVLRLGAIDGTVTRMSDTTANRAEFGTAGTAGTGYPQIRHLHISDAFTRDTFAAPTGPAGPRVHDHGVDPVGQGLPVVHDGLRFV
jgi:hypothetical protein